MPRSAQGDTQAFDLEGQVDVFIAQTLYMTDAQANSNILLLKAGTHCFGCVE